MGLDRALDEQADDFEVEGLGQVVVGAALHRLDRVRHGRLRGHDDDRRATSIGACARHHIEAARLGHPDVDEGDVDIAAGEGGERLLSTGRLHDLVALRAERLAEHPADRALVVDDENAGGDGLRHGRHSGRRAGSS